MGTSLAASELVSTRTCTPRRAWPASSRVPVSPGTKYGEIIQLSRSAEYSSFMTSNSSQPARSCWLATGEAFSGGSDSTRMLGDQCIVSAPPGCSCRARSSRSASAFTQGEARASSCHCWRWALNSSAVQREPWSCSARSGTTAAEFQKASNTALACVTAGPASSRSASWKLVSAAASKYSSPTLRPPTTASRLSAIQALLCMRRVKPTKRRPISSARRRPLARLRPGLNRRTSRLGCASMASRASSRPATFMSSSSRRTRTPRSAAAISSCCSRWPVRSPCQM